MEVPQVKWNNRRNIKSGNFPLDPVPCSIVKLSAPDWLKDDESIMKFVGYIHKIYCGSSVTLRVNDKTKPFLSKVLHMYTAYGDLLEESKEMTGTLKKMTDSLTKFKKHTEKHMRPMQSVQCCGLTVIFYGFRKKKMLASVKQLEPLINEIVQLSKGFVKDFEKKCVHYVYAQGLKKLLSICDIISETFHVFDALLRRENEPILLDFIDLRLDFSPSSFLRMLENTLMQEYTVLKKSLGEFNDEFVGIEKSFSDSGYGYEFAEIFDINEVLADLNY